MRSRQTRTAHGGSLGWAFVLLAWHIMSKTSLCEVDRGCSGDSVVLATQKNLDLTLCSMRFRETLEAGNDDLSWKYWLYMKNGGSVTRFFSSGCHLVEVSRLPRPKKSPFSKKSIFRISGWRSWGRACWNQTAGAQVGARPRESKKQEVRSKK